MFMRPREEPSVSEAEAPSLRGRVVAGVHVELWSTAATWWSTVRGDRTSRLAMSALANPSASRRTIST